MDGNQFDAFAKTFAVRSRRSFLKNLTGLIAGGVTALAGFEVDAASCRFPGTICREHANCCSGICGDPDRFGRRRCECQTEADCPVPSNKCKLPVCTDGTCTTTAITCTASDQCHLVGTCDPTTGFCSNPPAPNDTPCDDGNLCTEGDTCQNGTCAGTAVTCTASDQCHVAGTCDPTTGHCSNPNAPDNTPCNDGNSCTVDDTCQNGVCVGTPLNTDGDPCEDATDCCTDSTCTADGLCCSTGASCPGDPDHGLGPSCCPTATDGCTSLLGTCCAADQLCIDGDFISCCPANTTSCSGDLTCSCCDANEICTGIGLCCPSGASCPGAPEHGLGPNCCPNATDGCTTLLGTCCPSAQLCDEGDFISCCPAGTTGCSGDFGCSCCDANETCTATGCVATG